VPRKSARIEEKTIRLDASILPETFAPKPSQIRRWFTSNVLQGIWGIVFGWTGKNVKPISVTDAGWMRVAASSVPYEHNVNHSGNAADTWSGDLTFPKIVSRLDIFVWDNPLSMQRAAEGGLYESEIEVPANTMYSFDCTTEKLRVKNMTPGSVARYQIIGWY